MKSKLFESYLPEGALNFVKQWVKEENLTIKIRNTRKTKLGDYKFIRESNAHQITVNKDISSEAFFFVLTHEIAHLLVRIKFASSVKSHGVEWKHTFGQLLLESVEVYSTEMQPVILRHAYGPKASLSADKILMNNLFQVEQDESKRIENLSENQKFRLGKRIFVRGAKRKIRYLCKELQTGKLYTVSGSAVADEIFD